MRDTNINLWTDKEFIDTVKKLEAYNSYQDKVEFIFSLLNPSSDDLEPLLHPVLRTIKKETFCFGLPINNKHDANNIANAIIGKLTSEFYQSESKGLNDRIEKCFSIDDIKDLINEEIKLIKAEVFSRRNLDYAERLYTIGYSNQKTNKEYNFSLPLNVNNETLPTHYFSIGIFFSIARGGKDCLIEKDLNRLLRDLKSGKSIYNQKFNNKFDTPIDRSYDDNLNGIDPLRLIDPDFKSLFLEAEKKATDNTLKFKTAIRCAAFCELLFDVKKYILYTDTRQKTMVSFAKGRYDIHILKALATSKKADREKNKNKTVKKMPPLNRCF